MRYTLRCGRCNFPLYSSTTVSHESHVIKYNCRRCGWTRFFICNEHIVSLWKRCNKSWEITISLYDKVNIIKIDGKIVGEVAKPL